MQSIGNRIQLPPRAQISALRCRANMAHARQSRPDSGVGVQVKGLETFQVVPSLLGSGTKVISKRNLTEISVHRVSLCGAIFHQYLRVIFFFFFITLKPRVE